MIVFITKPCNYDFLSSGMRALSLWTLEPHYHHKAQPIGVGGPHSALRFVDKGWMAQNNALGIAAYPLLRQNPTLLAKVSEVVCHSCCPRTVESENWQQWDDTAVGHRTNFLTMLQSPGSDAQAHVNFKRFLLSVNLVSGEVLSMVPHVHWYEAHSSCILSHLQHIQESEEKNQDNQKIPASPEPVRRGLNRISNKSEHTMHIDACFATPESYVVDLPPPLPF